MGTVTFTVELILGFHKLKAVKGPAPTRSPKYGTSFSAGKATAQNEFLTKDETRVPLRLSLFPRVPLASDPLRDEHVSCVSGWHCAKGVTLLQP